MDQSGVFVEMSPSSIVLPIGSTDIKMKITGNEKLRFTVQLTCAADATKYEPMIIYKAKHIG